MLYFFICGRYTKMKGRLHEQKDVKKLKTWHKILFETFFNSIIVMKLISWEKQNLFPILEHNGNFISVINPWDDNGYIIYMRLDQIKFENYIWMHVFSSLDIFSLNYLSNSLKWKYILILEWWDVFTKALYK